MSQGTLICWRCDKPIRPGQPYTEYPKDSISAGGRTVVWHRELCRRRRTRAAGPSSDQGRGADHAACQRGVTVGADGFEPPTSAL